MKRHLLTIALVGLFGATMLSGEANACHKKKKCATPVACVQPCPPPPVCEPCPPPPCVETCAPAPKKCGHKFKLFGHKKRCEAACPAPYAAPVVYAAPVQPSHQFLGSGQGY